MNQTSIFDMLYDRFKITKPIRLIEFFSGYGSQALALKYLGIPFEHWKTCEWAIKSIQAYKDIHFPNSDIKLNDNRTKEDMVEFLYQKGISSNYNEPMSKDQINRLNEDTLKTIIKNIAITHNLVNIQQVKGKDLEIVDIDKYEYILTYSFPCQDLSLAGKGKGMSDTSTRSGMLWEVERILTECYEISNLPQILLMENVPQVHSQDNVSDFHKWQLRLEELGYKNYMQDLIATDYGIPQTRNRCFMISILGDYSYTFPQPIPLKLKLKDMLEDNVDEKYYLSDKQIEDVQNWNAYEKPLENMEKTDKTNISPTLTTRSGAYAAGMILIKNNNSKGYLEAEDGDGIDISSRMEYHRGTVQKGMTQTLTTKGGENNGVVVLGNYTPSNHNASRIVDKDYVAPTVMENHGTITAIVEENNDTLKRDLCNKLIQEGLVEEGDVVKHSYTSQILEGNKKCVEKNDGNMITLTTRGDCLGVVVNPLKGKTGKSWQYEQQIYDENGSARTLKASEGSGNIPKVVIPDEEINKQELRIRKLTPKECFRLMGVKDEDFENCARNQSDSSLYHLAGDSIVVNVLMAIFKELV